MEQSNRKRSIEIGDFVQLAYDLKGVLHESKYEVTYNGVLKKNNPFKSKKIFNFEEYTTTIVLPKILIFQNDAQNHQLFEFKRVQFKVLGIFLRPRDKSNGEKRNVIMYDHVFIQRMLDKKGYYFVLEDNINLQVFITKAIYCMPFQ